MTKKPAPRATTSTDVCLTHWRDLRSAWPLERGLDLVAGLVAVLVLLPLTLLSALMLRRHDRDAVLAKT